MTMTRYDLVEAHRGEWVRYADVAALLTAEAGVPPPACLWTHHEQPCPVCSGVPLPVPPLILTKMTHELRAYLDTFIITGDNIGDIRRDCFVPWDSEWNGIVRDETAQRERSLPVLPPKCEGECNPYQAKCGALFCSYEGMAEHQQTCKAVAHGQEDGK